MKRIFVILSFLAIVQQSYGLPAFVPLSKRAGQSQVVLVAEVISSRSQTVNKTIDAAELVLSVQKILKQPQSIRIPKKINLHFALYPDSYESKMRTTLPPGKYFVFLNVETIKKDKPNLFIFRLYEPNPFSFAEWNREDEIILKESL